MAAMPVVFPPSPFYNEHLTKTALSKGIDVNVKHQLIRVDKDNRKAFFKNLGSESGEEIVDLDFDFLHVVPPQTAPEFIATSPIAAANGYVDVN